MATVVKNVETKKIDLAWRSIMEQRTFYPVYPNNPATPIEWTQHSQMMYNETPNVMLIPSDLMLFAKVRRSTFIISFSEHRGLHLCQPGHDSQGLGCRNLC